MFLRHKGKFWYIYKKFDLKNLKMKKKFFFILFFIFKEKPHIFKRKKNSYDMISEYCMNINTFSIPEVEKPT